MTTVTHRPPVPVEGAPTSPLRIPIQRSDV